MYFYHDRLHKNDFKFEELNDIDFKGNILKLDKNTEDDWDIFDGIGKANEKRIVNFYLK